MITIKIGNSEPKSLDEIEEHWINQQVNRRKEEGEPVCVVVRINQAGLNIVLSTKQCGGSGGGGRSPNEVEKTILDLWDKRGLTQTDFNGGQLIAFLKQLHKYI